MKQPKSKASKATRLVPDKQLALPLRLREQRRLRDLVPGWSRCFWRFRNGTTRKARSSPLSAGSSDPTRNNHPRAFPCIQARAKDAVRLFEAIKTKLEQQAAYAAWRENIIPGQSQNAKKQISDRKSVLPEADPGAVQVHRWRFRLVLMHAN